MPDIERRSGVRVTVPDGLTVLSEPRPARRATRRSGGASSDSSSGASGDAARATPTDPESDALLAALEAQHFEVVDSVEIAARQAGGQRRRRSASEVAPGAAVNLAVDLAPGEDAVVLVEEDGEYRWQLPVVESVPAPAGARRGRQRRRGGEAEEADEAPPARTVTFTLTVSEPVAQPMGDGAGAPKRRGFIKRLLFGRVKAYVLKFTARFVAGAAIRHLERDVKAGLVHLSEARDPSRWTRLADDARLELGNGDQPRVLLLVHGTFSSTVGSFGHLAHTEHGRRFLEAAIGNYDAVIGYDHHTLSHDPRENAKALLARLRALGWPAGVTIDAVGFSRGGLVFRSLVEELLPKSGWRPRIDRAVFVGCTNAGTQLADPGNWHELVNLYTNLAAAACRGLSLVPSAAPFTLIFGEIISGVGALVKYLATHAVDEGGVPGLAAMQPDGKFVKELNGEQDGQPTPDDSYYCAITSDFEAKLATGAARAGIAPRLLKRLADGMMDRIMGEANDLVVHVDSMTAIDRARGSFVREKFDYGRNGVVFHTTYFSQPETVAALTTWLRLGTPAMATAAARRRRGASDVAPTRWTTPVVRPGALVTATSAGSASTNVVTTTAETRIGTLQDVVRRRRPDYVVVKRVDDGGEPMYYAFTAREVLHPFVPNDPDAPARYALDLHESGQSRIAQVSDVAAPAPTDPGAAASVGRTVMMESGRPVAVLPANDELADFVSVGAAPFPMPRRRTRRGGGATAGDAPVFAGPTGGLAGAPPKHESAPEPVECYFQAEMDAEVAVGRRTRVDVTISRERIEAAARGVSETGNAPGVRPDLPIEVQVVPKLNFETATERRGRERVRDDLREIAVPEPGRVERLSFVVQPTAEGDGELWVQARQGRLPLITLKLRTSIAAASAAESTTRSRKTRAAVTVTDFPVQRRQVDTLRVTEVVNGSQVRYDFDIELPNATPRRRLRKLSEPLTTDRERYIASLYEEIEDRWSHSEQSFDAFQRDLRSIGARMFRALVPRDVQKVLWEDRAEIGNIQVLSTEPFIPWELVYVTDPAKRRVSDDGCFLGEMGLVRWLYEDYPPESLRVRRGKARYVAPEYPLPNDRLDAAAEEAEILRAMFGAKAVDAVADTVYRLLERPSQFDLLHFACHGVADSASIDRARLKMTGAIVDGDYTEDYVYAGTVETDGDLRGRDGSHPLVVLNACQSARAGYSLNGIGGFAQAFVRAGAGAFVGTHWSVGDGAALTFVKSFYEALSKEGKTLGEAVTLARRAARDAGDATWLAYVAYGEPYARLEARGQGTRRR